MVIIGNDGEPERLENGLLALRNKVLEFRETPDGLSISINFESKPLKLACVEGELMVESGIRDKITVTTIALTIKL